ncbi:fibronectin type III domain-containing protein [Paenibacillus alba]|uniref:RCC1 domain-containing protein n=1 Tax=Paenibacillus alba TaxID=1197127 RepID=UPI001565F2DC|nr:fibronectin type III domain-containing protein [Paenibacillus alba]NQX68523.1 fibronectin type III domain-containing protein [Paenibacillus alba]
MARNLIPIGKKCLIIVLALILQTVSPFIAASYAEGVYSEGHDLVEAPDHLAVSSTTSTSISLTWRAVAGSSDADVSYQVKMVDTVGSSVYENVYSFNAAGFTHYTVKGLNAGQRYTFTVQAMNAWGPVSMPSSAIMASTLPVVTLETPSTPELRLTHRTSDSIGLGWTPSVDNAGVTAYAIYKDAALVTEVTYGTTAFTVQGLLAGQHYTFTVQAKDQLGNVSKMSNELKVTTLTEGKTSSTMSMGSGNALHTLAVQPDGSVWAWGNNYKGQLGDNKEIYRQKPIQIMGLPTISAVTVGQDHSLALAKDGSVWAWGGNNAGQLGNGTLDPTVVPARVPGLTNVVAVQAGEQHSLALLADGTVWAWGLNVYGQLGDGSTENRALPVQVAGLNSIAAISAGAFHNLAINHDGEVFSWGFNVYGQLGDNTKTNRLSPVHLAELRGVTSVSAGFYHSMAVKNDGTVWSWGTNVKGLLGDGTSTDRFTPIQTANLSSVVRVSAGALHSMALKDDGTVWTWGANNAGQLGVNSESSIPSELAISGRIAFISAGFMSSSAVSEEGNFLTWGYNGYGQLGDDTQTDAATPVSIQLKEISK